MAGMEAIVEVAMVISNMVTEATNMVTEATNLVIEATNLATEATNLVTLVEAMVINNLDKVG